MKKFKKALIIIICLLAILLIGGGTILHYYKTRHYITASLKEEMGQEITGALNRPDCGWYQLRAYYLRPGTALSASDLYVNQTDDSGYTYRLSLVEFNLAGYRTENLMKLPLIISGGTGQTLFRHKTVSHCPLPLRLGRPWP